MEKLGVNSSFLAFRAAVNKLIDLGYTGGSFSGTIATNDPNPNPTETTFWIGGEGTYSNLLDSNDQAIVVASGSVAFIVYDESSDRYSSTPIGIDLSSKVDKVEGKGLSSNDLTDTLLTTLNTVPNKVDKITGKGLSTNDLTNTLLSTLNTVPNKVDKVSGKALSTNDLTDSLLTSLQAQRQTSDIADAAITLMKMSQAVIDYINASGGGTITNQPDDLSLETVPGGGAIRIKEGYIGYAVPDLTALDALKSAGKTGRFLISGNVVLTADKIISNCELDFLNAGIISGAYTLTLHNCSIISGNRKIFSDNLSVKFTGQATKANITWFGAVGDGSDANKAENASAILKAAEAVADIYGAVYAPTGVYKSQAVDLSHLNSKILHFEGDGNFATFITLAVGENTYLLNAPTLREVTMKKMYWSGDSHTWNSSQSAGNNPGTPFLVKIGGYASEISCVIAGSGGDGLVLSKSQVYTLFRPACNYNWGYGIVVESHYGTYIYSPWCEYNYEGGLLVTHTYLAADPQRDRIKAGNYILGGSFEGCGKYGTGWSSQHPNYGEVAAVELRGVHNCYVETGTEQQAPRSIKLSKNESADPGYRSCVNNTIVVRENRSGSSALIKSGNYSNTIILQTNNIKVVDEDETNFISGAGIAPLPKNGIRSKEFLPQTIFDPSSISIRRKNPFAPSSARLFTSLIKKGLGNGLFVNTSLKEGAYYFRCIYRSLAVMKLQIQDVDNGYISYGFEENNFIGGSSVLQFPVTDDYRFVAIKFKIPTARSGNTFRVRLQFETWTASNDGDIEVAYFSVTRLKNAAIQFIYGSAKGIGEAGTGVSSLHEKAFNAGVGNRVYLSDTKAEKISDGWDWYDTAGVLSDTHAPEMVEGYVESVNTLRVYFDKKLTGSPANTDLSVKINTVAATITGYAITNNEIEITVSETISFGDAVLFAYVKPGSNQLQATPNGVDMASISDTKIINSI